MRGDLKVRKTRTASGAIAIQVVRHEGKRRIVVKHIGSAHDTEAQVRLLADASAYVQEHCVQPSLLDKATNEAIGPSLDLAHTKLLGVTHQFARNALLACAKQCGLSMLADIDLDFALMRIIEPASKVRTIELLKRYFDVSYAERTLYRRLPKLLELQEAVEKQAIQIARNDLQESLSLVLYDVTTLYFESFKEYDFQRPGFSKDNKPQQPQIMIGLITTRSGFPVMHEVFEGNTFEGSTMLGIVRQFQKRVGDAKPVIVADAAMLSRANMAQLSADGYRYVVGARLANMPKALIAELDRRLPRVDKAIVRLTPNTTSKTQGVNDDPKPQEGVITTICEFSEKRYKKDKRELDKQVQRALALVARKEPGRRAKFVKKSADEKTFTFDEELKAKAEKLLGIKGYVTNISEQELSSAQIIAHYHELWHVEHAFRMSKSDLRTRPIFHHSKDTIRAHVMLCFIALMIGKYLETKTGQSLRQVRDALWQVHEATLRDERSGNVYVLRTDTSQFQNTDLANIINLKFTH
jgi:transposase